MLDRATIVGGSTMGDVRSGTVSWVDLSTPDIKGAQHFYAGLLGWELEVQRTPMGEYTVASSGGREVAGMMAQAPDVAGMPATSEGKSSAEPSALVRSGAYARRHGRPEPEDESRSPTQTPDGSR
jgi:hypothetical protein